MKVLLGGVRGTSSIAQADFMRYGGETTSVLVRGRAGETVILDAGTGIRTLGARLAQDPPKEVLLLLTHYHLDHIVGWPSFPLLYQRGVTLRVASSQTVGLKVEQILSQLMNQPFWPVQMDSVLATLRFEKTPGHFGELRIRSCPVHHPGGCVAYRLDEPATGASLVFATDIEWKLSTEEEKKSFLGLCREPTPCRLLLFDGHYSRANYPSFAGWGHSCWEDSVEVARAAGAGRLLVIHHAPDSRDEQLDRVKRRLLASFPASDLAQDGMEVEP
jgi:phosphoribosyl 1,2-cyclic phosphodiesterase